MHHLAAAALLLAAAACASSATPADVGPGDVLFDASRGRAAISIRDCATDAPPVAGRPLCARVRWTTDGWSSAALNDVRVECVLDGRSARSRPAGPWEATVELGPTTAGAHRAECRVDASDLIAEPDERNNIRTVTIEVLGDVGAWRYDVAIEAIAPQLRAWKGPSCDRPRCNQFGVDLRLMNRGLLPIGFARIDCTGGGLVFAGSAHAVAAGEQATVTAWTTTTVQTDSLALTCTATLTEPHGIPELDESNNRREVTVMLRP